MEGVWRLLLQVGHRDNEMPTDCADDTEPELAAAMWLRQRQMAGLLAEAEDNIARNQVNHTHTVFQNAEMRGNLLGAERSPQGGVLLAVLSGERRIEQPA